VSVKPGDNVLGDHGPVLAVLEEQVTGLIVLDHCFVCDVGSIVKALDGLVADFAFASTQMNDEGSFDFTENLVSQHVQLPFVLQNRVCRDIRSLTQRVSLFPVLPPLR